MRDLALLLMLAVFVPVSVPFPFVGVYLWEWLSLMNPHRLVFGVAQNQPLNLIVAVVTVLSWAMSKERTKFRITGLAIALGLFAVWITLTTMLAPVPEVTAPLWSRNIKTVLLMFMIMALITNRVRLHGMIWIVAISLGFYGVRGGGFMMLTGGSNIVFGPSQSMIEDNNSLALALILALPLLNYLRQQTSQFLLRQGILIAMILVLASVFGSYSRGGFVAIGAMLFFLWLRSSAKIATSIVAVAALGMALIFMPQKYVDRIATMENVLEDESFRGRLDAWDVAWNVAQDRLFGAGFDGPRQEAIWQQYLPDASPRASHSIYFMVMGEHGFIGLALYLAICLLAWRDLRHVLRAAADASQLQWAKNLAAAFQMAIVGFLVGGAALSMAYYDGFLSLLVLSSALRRVVETTVQPNVATQLDGQRTRFSADELPLTAPSVKASIMTAGCP